MRIFLTLLFALCLPLVGKAEYSRTYLDSYPLQIATVGELAIAYRIVEPGPDKPKVVVIDRDLELYGCAIAADRVMVEWWVVERMVVVMVEH